MKPWDERTYEAVAKKRYAFFKPAASLLSRAGISPDLISYCGLAAALAFIYVIGRSFTGSFWLIVALLVLDQLDGAVARYRNTTSDRGKFVDVSIDTTTFALIMIGLAHAGLLGAATAAAYIYFATAQRISSAIRKNINRPNSKWLFYAGAGPLPSTFIYATYLLFGIAVFTGHSYLESSSVIFAGLLAVKASVDFWAIRYQA